ncbi:MAG TPA: SRPBCC family protein [Solirubrobacteraceae bacterium]|jgi:carbon monoxide dehydrogenase subunit G
MPSVTKTVELGVPQEEAFRLATDPNRFGEWLTLHQSWPNGAPESTDTGTEFVQKLSIMGMPADVSWTVEAYESPSRMALRGAGPMGAQLATNITAEADGDGTRVSYEAEFSGGGIQGPMSDMVTKKAGEEIETSLGKLKELAG